MDVSRGLAFLMVIYSHLEFCDPVVMRYFKPVFLTTFFFVSGWLFKDKCKFSYVLEQRTRTLLLPMLALGLIMILMEQVLTFGEKVPLIDSLKGLLFQNGENQILWFIAALYVYSIFFYFVERLAWNSNLLLIFSLVLFIVNAIYSKCGGPALPWHIDGVGYACFYMGLGKFYRDNAEKCNRFIDNKWFVACCIIVYISSIAIFDLDISYSGSKYIIDAIVITLTGLVAMIYISKHILNNSRFLLFVGANTLFYFAFHGKGYSLLTVICHSVIPSRILDIALVNDIIALAIVLLDAALLVVPAIIVNKYMPFLLGRGFKLWQVKS